MIDVLEFLDTTIEPELLLVYAHICWVLGRNQLLLCSSADYVECTLDSCVGSNGVSCQKLHMGVLT